MKILVVGELNVDLVLQDYSSFPTPGKEVLVERASLTLGSASAICAAGLARLGNEVAFAGKLGCDTWGDLVLARLNELSIDVSRILRSADLTTGITVSVSSAADRALITYLGSSEALHVSDVQEAWLEDANHLHVSSFYLQRGLRPDLKTLFARAHALGLTTSLDPGCDPLEEWGRDLLDVLTEVDIFLPNEVELAGVTGEQDPALALRRLQNGRTLTVAKLGASGCMAIVDGGLAAVSAFPVAAVDTTGAGDSFNAGFLHAFLRGEGTGEAIRFGAACGALSTLGVGGTTAQPDAQEAARFMLARV
ncbi:MAG TPA: carbohydrate kinase family protein [Paludibaculum sp.]|jgi:sugar/nucleoside kinase (ribokinase family)